MLPAICVQILAVDETSFVGRQTKFPLDLVIGVLRDETG
jgi:hypothetical protein